MMDRRSTALRLNLSIKHALEDSVSRSASQLVLRKAQQGKPEAARRADALRKALLDSVIHELCTPLTSIKASVTALLTIARLKSIERDELLTIIDEEADRLNLLVGEAVERGRLDVGERLNLGCPGKQSTNHLIARSFTFRDTQEPF
jgi:K+-sensing histidine kinase KdpD